MNDNAFTYKKVSVNQKIPFINTGATKSVAIAYNAFYTAIKRFIPAVKVVTSYGDLDKYDLIIFTGGEDINPAFYQENNLYSSYNEHRDYVENTIYRYANGTKKILGICRGHQLITALFGGTLYQDIGIQAKVYHDSVHPLDILQTGVVSKYFGDINVISAHHQGVNRIPENLHPTTSHMGIIESFESDNVITVQFHPEFVSYSDPKFQNSQNFFDFLVKEW